MIEDRREQRAKETQIGRGREEASMHGPGGQKKKKKRESALATNELQTDTEKEIVFGHAIDVMYLGHVSVMFMAFYNPLP